MNKLKKLLSIISIFVIWWTQLSANIAHWETTYDPEFASALDWMYTNWLTQYYTEDYYLPNKNLTREQAAKFFTEFATKILWKEADESLSCDFNDTYNADSSLKDYIVKSCQLWLMNGNNNKFMPKATLTKAQALTILVRALDWPQSENTTPWWNNYFQKARELWITNETNTNKLSKTVSRWEIALLLYRSWTNASNIAQDTTSDLWDILWWLLSNWTSTNTDSSSSSNWTSSTTTDNTTTDNVIVSTNNNLEITLDPASPVSQAIPSVGTVRFGSFNLKAWSSDVSVNSITFRRQWLWQRSDFSRIWIEQDNVRITSRQTIASDNTVTLTFYPSLVIKANSVENIDLVASLNSSVSSSQHSFAIVSSSDISASTNDVWANYPISTNLMTTSSYQVANVAFLTGWSSSNYNAWLENVELWQFKIQNNAWSDSNVIFKSLTLKNEGNGDAAASLSNLKIYRWSTAVSTNTKFDGKYITFTIDNDAIAFGRQETYYIRANVDTVDNTNWDTYKFSLRYSDDISVVEEWTLFQTKITWVDSSTSMATYTVNWWDSILSRSTAYSSSQTVSPWSNDVVLLSADVKISQSVNLGDLTVSLNNNGWYSGTLADLANAFTILKLKIWDAVVSTYTPSSSTSNSFMFEWTYYVNKNTTIQIVGNMRSSAYGKFQINELSASNFATKEYASNWNSVQSNQFIWSVAWIVTSVGSAALTFTRNDWISNQSLVIWSKDRTLMQFVARANDVSSINITKLKFVPWSSTSTWFNTSLITNIRLYANDTLISTKSMSAGNADFNDINILVSKNSDVTLKVVWDFSSAVTAAQVFQIALNSSSLIEARDSNWISISTSPSMQWPVYTFVDAWWASVSMNSSTPSSKLLTPSSTEIEVWRYTLSAQNDSLRLTDLYLYNLWTADLSSRIKTISLYDTNWNKLAWGSVLWTGIVAFSLGSSSSFIIPKNTSNSPIIVKAAFNDIISDISSENTLRLWVWTWTFNVTTVDWTSNWVRLVSESIGNTVSSVTLSNAVTNTHLIARSKVVASVWAAATQSTHTINITVDNTNRVMLTWLKLSVSNPASWPTSYTLYKDSENAGNEVANGTFSAWTLNIDFTNWVEISAWDTKSFILVVSNNAWTPDVNSKRIVRVTDMKYVDMMDIWSNNTITSVANYSNVWLPTAESTFTY